MDEGRAFAQRPKKVASSTMTPPQLVPRRFAHSTWGFDAERVLWSPGHALEREAAQVADQLMRDQPVTVRSRAMGVPLQRACASCSAGKGTCPECDEEALPPRRKRLKEPFPRADAETRIGAVLAGGGAPLDARTRADMEPRFAFDFSQVRIHTGPAAAQSTAALRARAFTVGRDIVFGPEEYDPSTHNGRRLLAHELAHVVQQYGEPFAVARQVDAGAPEDAADTTRNPQEACVRRLGGCPETRSAGIPTAEEIHSYNEQCRNETGYSGADVQPVCAEQLEAGPAEPACRVDVRATHIGGSLSWAPVWHLFVIYAATTGEEYFFRGGPHKHCPRVDGDYGGIRGDSGRYVPGTVDWDPSAPSVTVLSGSAACGKDSCLQSQLARIDSLCVPYKPLGPNSNTVARSLLSNCSIPEDKPVWVAPGWGDPAV